MTKETTKPGNAESTDKSTTTSTDKPADPDSTGSTDSKSSDCGETNGATKEASSKQSDALSVALMTQQLPLPSKFSGSDLSSEETFEE